MPSVDNEAVALAHLPPPTNGKPQAAPSRGDLLRVVWERLHAAGIRYCRWKGGPWDLGRVVSGAGDMDLLVDRKGAVRFEGVLAFLGFKRAVDVTPPPLAYVSHYYGLDPASGALIHLHVYTRLLTGDALTQNYRLPLEELILQSSAPRDGVLVVQPPAELVLVVLRTMVKYASVSEYLLFPGAFATLHARLHALLLVDDAVPHARELLGQWLPCVDPNLFEECLASLQKQTSFWHRFRLARRLRRQLRPYRRFSTLAQRLLWGAVLADGAWRRLCGRRASKSPACGGMVIAFVGADACGKSTQVREATRWLSKVFRTESYHLGKPPSTWLTFLPNLAGRLVRRLVPRSAAGPAAGSPSGAGRPGFLYGCHAVLLAWDRRALAHRLTRRAAAGWIVVCDRYPSPVVGAMDSARLSLPPPGVGKHSLIDRLALLENRLYCQVPPPDVVIQLSAPVELAVERNRSRREDGKERESEAYVRHRHATAVPATFRNAHVIDVVTDRPLPETLRTVQSLLWDLL